MEVDLGTTYCLIEPLSTEASNSGTGLSEFWENASLISSTFCVKLAVCTDDLTAKKVGLILYKFCFAKACSICSSKVSRYKKWQVRPFHTPIVNPKTSESRLDIAKVRAATDVIRTQPMAKRYTTTIFMIEWYFKVLALLNDLPWKTSKISTITKEVEELLYILGESNGC